MEYPRLDGRDCNGRSKMAWLEVVSKDWKELGICKACAGQNEVKTVDLYWFYWRAVVIMFIGG